MKRNKKLSSASNLWHTNSRLLFNPPPISPCATAFFHSVLTLFCPAATRAFSLVCSYISTFLTTGVSVDCKPMRFFGLRKSLIGNRSFPPARIYAVACRDEPNFFWGSQQKKKKKRSVWLSLWIFAAANQTN